MVDFRPLLFINALALMLLVTAGFASVHKEMVVVAEPSPETTLPPVEHQASAESPPEPEPGPPVEAARSPAVNTEPFTIPSLPEEPTVLAMAEPVAAMNHSTATVAPPEPSPKPETASTPWAVNCCGVRSGTARATTLPATTRSTPETWWSSTRTSNRFMTTTANQSFGKTAKCGGTSGTTTSPKASALWDWPPPRPSTARTPCCWEDAEP